MKNYKVNKKELNLKKLTNKSLITIIGISLFSWYVLDYLEKRDICTKCNGTGRKT